MTRLQLGAPIADVVQIESDEPYLELRHVEVPFPFFVGKRKELAKSRSLNVVGGSGGRLVAQEPNLMVMIAQGRHEGNRTKHPRVGVDQRFILLDGVLRSIWYRFVHIAHVVAGRHEQMNL